VPKAIVTSSTKSAWHQYFHPAPSVEARIQSTLLVLADWPILRSTPLSAERLQPGMPPPIPMPAVLMVAGNYVNITLLLTNLNYVRPISTMINYSSSHHFDRAPSSADYGRLV
jgi:hypothetical protein